MEIDNLAQLIKPERTILLLGAGACVPSGGPTGPELAQRLASRLGLSTADRDLSELSGIFENRRGRRELVETVREQFTQLEPTGGLLAIPSFSWRRIYSTNFDRLVEKAYQRADKALLVVRSNFEFADPIQSDAILYKIHGCISQDVAFGDQARMVLTEQDYDEYSQYREALFNSLKLEMMTSDTLIIGQSLSDVHLRDMAKQVASLRSRGAQGRVFLLAFDYDEDRAALFRQRGIQAVDGGVDELVHALEHRGKLSHRPIYSTSTTPVGSLTPALVTTTIDVAHAATLSPDAKRVFNGSPATYADIRAGYTITRANETRLEDAQNGARGFFLVLGGAAGVGKTSLARRLLLTRHDQGFACWEHRNDFPLNSAAWLEVEANLRNLGQQGIILLDDCSNFLTEVNRLVDALGALERPFLRVVATVNASQWKTRVKSKFFYSKGTYERLSILSNPDIAELLRLIDSQAEIRQLVDSGFLRLGWQEKVRHLRDRCSADMFVCLKNIFGNEQLDNILLQEYAELGPDAQQVYRHVAAIQAMGGRVHRQLVLRLLGIGSDGLNSLLGQMDGIVDEYDIDPDEGLYGWTTRHHVIARIISTYKYANQTELYSLIESLIDGLNPTVYIELETGRAIASESMGIARLTDVGEQRQLLSRLTNVVPAERTPRRRLIRSLLRSGELGEAERQIGLFEQAIGNDTIVNRYKAMLAMQRAEATQGILDEDRQAMLLEAQSLALKCIYGNPMDRYNYRVLGDIGLMFRNRFDDTSILDQAIDLMRDAGSDIGDPDFIQERQQLESSRRVGRTDRGADEVLASSLHALTAD